MQKNRDLLRYILFFMALGSSLYSLFLPIYYIEHGVPYHRIILFIISYCVGGVLSGVFSNYIISKLGIKSFILARGILEPLTIILINYYPVLKYPVELQGMVSGFITFAFWVSLDSLTVKTTDKDSRGKQQGSMYGWMWVGNIISPFIGGFIIARFSYTLLFIIAFLLVLTSGILSFFIGMLVEVNKKLNYFPTMGGNIGRFMILSMLRGGTFTVIAFIFPLFLFDLTKSELVVGSYGLVFGLAAFFATLLSGYLIDRFREKALFYLLSANTAFWFLLGLKSEYFAVFTLVLIVYFFYSSINVCLNTLFFDEIEKLDAVTLVSERIICFCLGGAILISAALFFGYYSLFLLCGAACLASVFVLRNIDQSGV